MFAQITILGPGLLGASLAMAAKERQLTPRVVAWSRRAETRELCAQQIWCDAVFDTPEAAVNGSDLVVICTPVETIPPLLEQVVSHLGEGALVTDVGSTKNEICARASASIGNQAIFIGSHPMAGSEQTGLANAKPDLFQNAACILTPEASAPAPQIDQLTEFWEALGMCVATTTPEQHDEIVAHISHLPHLLASVLCGYLSGKDGDWKALSGPGLRDCTRVASGDPDLWLQILEQNRDEVLTAINGLEKQLQHFKQALSEKNADAVKDLLQQGKTYRDQLTCAKL